MRHTDTTSLDVSVLTGLAQSIHQHDPTSSSIESIKELLNSVRLSRQLLTGFESTLVHSLEALADTGAILSTADTLMTAGLMSPAEAKKTTQRRRAADELPALGTALRSGAAPTDNLDSITKAFNRLDDDAKERFRAVEEDVIAKATTLPPNLFRPYLNTEVEHARQDFGLSEYEQQVKDSTLALGTNSSTGMVYLRGSFDPVRGEKIISGLDAMVRSMARQSNESSTYGEQLKVDALAALCARPPTDQGSIRPTSFGVIVDAETLLHGPHDASVRQTRDFGLSLSQPTVERLACDCEIHTLLLDANGVSTAVGRTYRSATRAQRLALRAMYGASCGIVGCDTPFAWCEMHHIEAWEHGGKTHLDNLIPLCREHHHQVHEGGWSIHLDNVRTLTIRRPDGSVFQVQQLPSRPVSRKERSKSEQPKPRHRSSSPPGKQVVQTSGN